MPDVSEDFCNRSIQPWIMALVCLGIFTAAWLFFRGEDLALNRAMLAGEGQTNYLAPIWKPSEPAEVGATPTARTPAPREAPAATPAPPSAPTTPAAPQPAAPERVNPDEGLRQVALRSQTGFQNSLKDSINHVIYTVCDIHATWARKQPAAQPKPRAGTDFVPPFDGTIDKFYSNRGFENIGAGLLVDSQGYVLTNYHVVQNADTIIVTVSANPQDRDYVAKIFAQDPSKDLALLKLDTLQETFPESPLGDSSMVQLGDLVIAIGSPFGIEQTVTSGIISGIRKSVLIGRVRYDNLLQTDAPINRGSSGGALVNLSGEVIGINSAIYAPTGVSNGTGFAIPINDAKSFLALHLDRGFPLAVNKAGRFTAAPRSLNTPADMPAPVRFGLEVMPLGPVMAKQFGVDQDSGLLINRVVADSPAERAGVQRGDIVSSIAGIPVRKVQDIPSIVRQMKQGDRADIGILRKGQRLNLVMGLW
ncbi:MAG: trypsin-like peptidase domain-containing protein [Planctomycetes bacterium]|nr:trypsin-like peptidase domain-containing protein [Planctomycetota bacterium]